MIVEYIIFALFLLIPAWLGAGENRLYREGGKGIIFGHFSIYHVWLALLFLIPGLIGGLVFDSWIFPIFYMVYAPLGLDIVWWVWRYYDFKTDYKAAVVFYGELNAWHEQKDWDNWLGLPIYGVYWWWYVFGILSVILGVLVFVI